MDTLTAPRPADPTAAYCHLCGADRDATGAPAVDREHGSCREAREAFRAAETMRALEDGARAFDRFRAARRAG